LKAHGLQSVGFFMRQGKIRVVSEPWNDWYHCTANSKCIPISNRAHELNVARYIYAHRANGAAVWKVSTGAKPGTA
jgi:hypothetical protein